MHKPVVLIEIEYRSDEQLLEVIRRLEHMGLESESDQKHDLYRGDSTVVIRGLLPESQIASVKDYPYVVNVWANPDKACF